MDRNDRTHRDESDLDRATRETRQSAEAPPVDWAGVEAKLFARVKADAEEKRRRGAHPMWLPIAGVLAAAAVAAIVVGRPGDAPMIETPVAQVESAAGSVVARDGEGDVLIDGRAATAGTTVGAHAVVETRGSARVLIERAGKVSFWVEPASRLVVSRSPGKDGALVLALDRGAVEALVTPVAQGDAFAVDVGDSRVAVQGAHLRVARDGSHVTVDVTEGVASIGASSRSGLANASTIASPAHAEFTADDATASLKIDHTPSAVRAAVAFAIPVAPVAPAPTIALAPTTTSTSTTPTPIAPAPVAPSAPKPDPSSSAPAAVAAVSPDPHAEKTIAIAVRACLASRPPSSGVKLTVSTVIDLKIRDDGSIEMAKFDPPLAPDAQACASSAIYRVHFAHGGSVSIPIEYSYSD